MTCILILVALNTLKEHLYMSSSNNHLFYLGQNREVGRNLSRVYFVVYGHKEQT